MSKKAETGLIMSPTPRPNRRALIVTAIGAALSNVALDGPKGAGMPTPEYQECARLWLAATAVSDEDVTSTNEQFDLAVNRLMANADPDLIRHVGEISSVWRQASWIGSRKTTEFEDPDIERHLWRSLARLTGIEPPENAAHARIIALAT